MIEKRKEFIDQGGAFGALLPNRSKAFYCFPHDIMIAKPHRHRLKLPLLVLRYSYLSNRKH